MEDKSNARTGISFSFKRGRFRIYRATMKAMEEPEHIRILMKRDEKMLALQAMDHMTMDTIEVPKTKGQSQSGYEVSSQSFIEMIYEMCGWDPACSYAALGYKYPQKGVVIFDLKEAEERKPDRVIDRGSFSVGERQPNREAEGDEQS